MDSRRLIRSIRGAIVNRDVRGHVKHKVPRSAGPSTTFSKVSLASPVEPRRNTRHWLIESATEIDIAQQYVDRQIACRLSPADTAKARRRSFEP